MMINLFYWFCSARINNYDSTMQTNHQYMTKPLVCLDAFAIADWLRGLIEAWFRFHCFEEASGSVQDHVRGVCSWKNDVPDGSGYRVDISQVSIMIFPMKIKLNCKFGVPYLKTNAKFSSIWLGIEIMMIQYDSYLHRGLCISEFWSGFCVCVC